MKVSPGFLFLLFNPLSKLPWSHRLDLWGYFRLTFNPPAPWTTQNDSGLSYVTMSGAAHIDLLIQSLRSISLNWNGRPKLSIISDGTFDEAKHLRDLAFWGEKIEIITPDEVFSGLPKELSTPLKKLSFNQPLILKLAAIIFLSTKDTFFFADADVLWFKDPTVNGLLDSELEGVRVTRESGCSLNENLAKAYCPELITEKSVNSGCIWVGTDLTNKNLLRELIEFAVQEPADVFTEQTIIGTLASSDSGFFPDEICFLKFDDAGKIRNHRPWLKGFASRHYVGPVRHHFFRDALRLSSARLEG